MNKRTCSIPECNNTHRARGLCNTHYGQAHQPNRHPKKLVECVWCGIEILKQPGGGRKHGYACSNECRGYMQFPYSKLPTDHWALWFGKASAWKPKATKPEAARFTANTCNECGKGFIDAHTGSPSHYCSRTCQRRVMRRARKASEHGSTGTFRWADVIRLWMAAGKQCGYCDAVMTGQPDPDHVVPISRGGRNDLGNILACCRLCNADKGDLTLDEWRDSREQRGMEPRRYSLDATDSRYKHLMIGEATGVAYRHRQPA